MFQGFMNVAEILDPRGWSPDRIAESAGGFANDLVGGSSLRRSLENALASNMSDYKNWAQATIGKLSGGILGEKVERIDVLTGKPMPTKYANYLNLINPFTVVGKDKAPLLDSLEKVDFPIGAVIPRRVGGVELTPDERNFLGLPSTPTATLSLCKPPWLARASGISTKPGNRTVRRCGCAKEESAWYTDLAKIVANYRKEALNDLRNGNSEVSKNYRETYPARSARLGSGAGGELNPAQQGAIRRSMISLWGK